MDKTALIDHLRAEEGCERSVYKDHRGYSTIGVGHLVDKRLNAGLSDNIINIILEEDLGNVFDELDAHVPWWREMPNGPKLALAAMCFQMGWPRLSKFKKTLAFLEAGDYASAADEALDSSWKMQTPERAERVAQMMRIE